MLCLEACLAHAMLAQLLRPLSICPTPSCLSSWVASRREWLQHFLRPRLYAQ